MTTYKSQMIQFRAGDLELTEAQWTANANVYPEGIIAITTDGDNAGRTKIFDGVRYWSQLPYTNGTGSITVTTFVVASSGSVSGIYRDTGVEGQVTGVNVWQLVGGSATDDIITAISSGGGAFLQWRWFVAGVIMYTSSDNVADPSLVTTWTLDNGATPLPSTKKYEGTLQEVLEGIAEEVGVTTRVYRALLTQTGTAAPAIALMRNELSGTPIASYVSPGQYRLTLTGAFPPSKTSAILQNNSDDGAVVTIFSAKVNSGGNYVSIVTGDGQDNLDEVLSNTLITIEVQP